MLLDMALISITWRRNQHRICASLIPLYSGKQFCSNHVKLSNFFDPFLIIISKFNLNLKKSVTGQNSSRPLTFGSSVTWPVSLQSLFSLFFAFTFNLLPFDEEMEPFCRFYRCPPGCMYLHYIRVRHSNGSSPDLQRVLVDPQADRCHVHPDHSPRGLLHRPEAHVLRLLHRTGHYFHRGQDDQHE